MSKKVANMVPKWAQVGAMLGSKIVLGVSKSGKNDTENGTGIELEFHTLRLPRRCHNAERRRVKMASPGGLGGYLAKAKYQQLRTRI